MEADRELEVGRIDSGNSVRLLEMYWDLRTRWARLLGVDTGELALTHHTTDGMNIGTWSLNWQPGDEIVVTTLEHEGGLMPAYMVGRRRGVTVRIVDLGTGGQDVVDRLQAAITPRTRLISLSHVSFSSGARLPLADIVSMAHRRGVMVLVDGAQSAGAIPLDLHDLGVDMYTVPGQKWLCGPEGIGAFYVRRDLLSQIQPTTVGYGSLLPDTRIDLTGEFQLAPSSRRYEVGSVYRPGLFGMRESLRWLEEDVGWEWAYQRIAHLSARAADLLAGLPGVQVLTPPSRAGLVSFTAERGEPETIVAVLAERDIRIRWVKYLRCLRVSAGFYNTEEDLVQLRDALGEVLAW